MLQYFHITVCFLLLLLLILIIFIQVICFSKYIYYKHTIHKTTGINARDLLAVIQTHFCKEEESKECTTFFFSFFFLRIVDRRQ